MRIYNESTCAEEIESLYRAGLNGSWGTTYRLTRTWNAFDPEGNFYYR